MFKRNGFTIIELMIVMLIMATGYLTVSYIYEQQRKVEEYQRVTKVAELAGKAGVEYYRKHCGSIPFIQPTEAILIAEKLVSTPQWFDKPLGSALSFNVIDMPGTEVTINVSSEFSSDAIAKQIGKYSKNTSVINNIVTWSFNPSYQSNHGNINMNQIAGAFGGITC